MVFRRVRGGDCGARASQSVLQATDLGLEGSLLAGILGGYVSGLVSGILISIPAMLHGEPLTMPLLAAIGVLGGLLRDCARDPEDIWRFSPFFDLNVYRVFKQRNYRRGAFHLLVSFGHSFRRIPAADAAPLPPGQDLCTRSRPRIRMLMDFVALYATTLFAVVLPLKIWNNTRNENKTRRADSGVLMQARLQALTSQINPHFLFNTLNSVSSLIRTDPHQARLMVLKLSRILRRLLRKHENFSPLRDELDFIDDYLVDRSGAFRREAAL